MAISVEETGKEKKQNRAPVDTPWESGSKATRSCRRPARIFCGSRPHGFLKDSDSAALNRLVCPKRRYFPTAEPQLPQNFISMLTQHGRATFDFARRLR
jgi:hypothetical protein